jgi:diadenosine tetraphosphatase ApaH/serine/threonine PP2A family protein phosphatase
MRLAILADIHANREALEAVLADVRRTGFDRLAFLGDIVGYGADPAACVDRVAEAVAGGALALLGNHDEALGRDDADLNADARRAIEWTRGRLDSAQAAFLAGLPLTATLDDLLLAHANGWAPRDWGYINGAVEAERSMRRTAARLTIVGHTHVPAVYHLAGDRPAAAFDPVAGVAIPFAASGRRWLAVLGAVGQPRDRNPAACWGLLETAPATLTLRRVPYDAAGAAARIRAEGLPERLAARLLTGD